MFWVQRYDIFRILQGFCGKNIVYLIGERSSCSVIQVVTHATGQSLADLPKTKPLRVIIKMSRRQL